MEKEVLQNLVNGLEWKKYFLEIGVGKIMTSKINHTEEGRHKKNYKWVDGWRRTEYD